MFVLYSARYVKWKANRNKRLFILHFHSFNIHRELWLCIEGGQNSRVIVWSFYLTFHNIIIEFKYFPHQYYSNRPIECSKVNLVIDKMWRGSWILLFLNLYVNSVEFIVFFILHWVLQRWVFPFRRQKKTTPCFTEFSGKPIQWKIFTYIHTWRCCNHYYSFGWVLHSIFKIKKYCSIRLQFDVVWPFRNKFH